MTRDGEYLKKGYKRGKWAGKMVLLKKPHFDAIETWAKKSGMSKASFYRAALMRGALDMAKGMGFVDTFPDVAE